MKHFLRACSLALVCLIGIVPLRADTAATITVQEAYDLASSGDILLVDVRWPHEWEETGIAAPAHAISMHEPGFLESLDELVEGDHSRTIALICAVGVRTAFLQNHLAQYEYSSIVNVAEGMLGSDAGPGWLASELPVRAYEQP